MCHPYWSLSIWAPFHCLGENVNTLSSQPGSSSCPSSPNHMRSLGLCYKSQERKRQTLQIPFWSLWRLLEVAEITELCPALGCWNQRWGVWALWGSSPGQYQAWIGVSSLLGSPTPESPASFWFCELPHILLINALSNEITQSWLRLLTTQSADRYKRYEYILRNRKLIFRKTGKQNSYSGVTEEGDMGREEWAGVYCFSLCKSHCVIFFVVVCWFFNPCAFIILIEI